MNTSNAQTIPLLKEARKRDYVFVLEDLELAFPREQLSQITKSWNNGRDLDQIAKDFKRQPLEILLALIHQARSNRVRRPFSRRISV